MSNRKKDKRRFRRYRKKLDFELSIGGKSFRAATIDYSVDGLSAEVEDGPQVEVGDILGIDIPNPNMKIDCEVVWSIRGSDTTKLGLKKVGELSGSIADYRLADVLLGLQRGSMTGVLVVSNGLVRKSIYVEEGDVVFAASSDFKDRLGNLLLKEGRVTKEQFDRASQIVVMQGKRLGTVLVEFGVLTPKDLFNVVTRNVENIVSSLFPWTDGEFILNEGPLPTDEVIKLNLSVGNIIYKGIKGIQDMEVIVNGCPPLDSVVGFSPDPRNLFQDIAFDTPDKELLKQIDGKKTIQSLIDNSGMEKSEAIRSIFALLSTRLIEVFGGLRDDTDIPAEAVIGETDRSDYEDVAIKIMKLYEEYEALGYYGVLGVDSGADRRTIKKAYYNMAKEFHPDRHFHLPPDTKDKLNAIFTYITTAYTTLTNPSLRNQYDNSSRSPSNAETPTGREIAVHRFKEGLAELDNGNFGEAARLFGAAAYLDGSVAKHHFYCGLALEKEGKHREAERAISRAIKIEPSNASYLAEAGHVYLSLGLPKRARSNFERALKVDAKNRRAMEGMEKLPNDI